MPKVQIQCVGGPLDGQVFQLEQPYILVPDDSLELPGWFTKDTEPKVSGQGYYAVDSPETMEWIPEPGTP